MSKITRVTFFVLGAAFTQIAGPYIQDTWDRGYDVWCGSSISLAQGKAALAKALRDNRPELVKEAKVALEKSARCRRSEAQFLLGLIHCNGLGGQKNPALGRQLIRNAISHEPQWAMEILMNPELCRAEH